MTETAGEVIDLVALFRASQRRHRLGLAITVSVAPMSWVLAAHESTVVWIALAVAITALVAWQVAMTLRKLAELKRMIANPYWSRPGVRSWMQTQVDAAHSEGKSALCIVYGEGDA